MNPWTQTRIRKIGFRKWTMPAHRNHFYLITCFGIIMTASAVELSGRRESLGGLLFAAGLGLGGCVLSLFGWQRYKRIMMVAEHIGDHATCVQCNAYAKFTVVDAGRALHAEPVDIQDAEEVWLKVECRKCGNKWTI